MLRGLWITGLVITLLASPGCGNRPGEPEKVRPARPPFDDEEVAPTATGRAGLSVVTWPVSVF